MNVKSILIWAMAIGTLSSCMSNEDMYDPEKAEALKVAKYEAAFVKKYGKVDPKQDWGFGEAEAAMQAAVTRVPNMDGNNWYTMVEEIPEAVSEAEIEMVKEAFSQKEESTPNLEMRWSDFFIQQVYWPKDRRYVTKSGQTVNVYISNIRYGDKNSINIGNNGEIQENSINSALNTFLRRERMVFLCDEPLNGKFCCQISMGTDSDFDDHYLIKQVGDSYYVGYDLESRGGTADQEVERDYVFNDAIFKIVPACRKDIRRIMAEDLATDEGGDFDFNDVVFDAKVYKGEWSNNVEHAYAEITLRAAGGTLPLYIGQKKPEYEVHRLFGVEQTTMVNTQEGKETEISPIKFKVELVDLPREAWGSISDGHPTLDDIPIYVGDSDTPLKGTVGEVPSKLCCPSYYTWSNERKSIEDTFPNFNDAVAKGTEWYAGGNPGWQ